MGGKWDYGLQLHGVHHTQELLAQLEFCGTVTTGPRRCGEYAQKYFFPPPLATLTMKVSQNFTSRLRLIGMYGPPQSCKRKTKNGSWSAPMYSAFSGVSDSGP